MFLRFVRNHFWVKVIVPFHGTFMTSCKFLRSRYLSYRSVSQAVTHSMRLISLISNGEKMHIWSIQSPAAIFYWSFSCMKGGGHEHWFSSIEISSYWNIQIVAKRLQINLYDFEADFEKNENAKRWSEEKVWSPSTIKMNLIPSQATHSGYWKNISLIFLHPTLDKYVNFNV